jgi:hypothetical protein
MHNKMFLQWCGDVLAISIIFVHRLVLGTARGFKRPARTQIQNVA